MTTSVNRPGIRHSRAYERALGVLDAMGVTYELIIVKSGMLVMLLFWRNSVRYEVHAEGDHKLPDMIEAIGDRALQWASDTLRQEDESDA